MRLHNNAVPQSQAVPRNPFGGGGIGLDAMLDMPGRQRMNRDEAHEGGLHDPRAPHEPSTDSIRELTEVFRPLK